ncbi:MAG: site-specific integrase [Bernardetiaceae bacterium]|jgi:integrase|nr:site-specific integrase [Bernardetiaceae bacterium]
MASIIPSVSFRLREESIYLHVRYKGERYCRLATRLTIKPENWNSKKHYPKTAWGGYSQARKDLDRVADLVQDYFAACRNRNHDPSKEEAATELRKLIDGESNSELTFFGALDEFLAFKGAATRANTHRSYNSLKTILAKFEDVMKYDLTFDRISREFEGKLQQFFSQSANSRFKEGPGLATKTRAKRVGQLKVFMSWALEMGYHQNETFRKFDSSRKDDRIDDIVVLTEGELGALRDHDLKNNRKLEKVRDIFLFMVYTAQRWSDVEVFDPRDIKDGVWAFVAGKTNKPTRVPLAGWCAGALTILSKYGGDLPRPKNKNFISQQKFNLYIKEVCYEVGITQPEKIHRLKGRTVITIEGPKNTFITSHCARRTAITILATWGIPLTVLQQLTGHSDVETLMRYVRTPPDALEKWLTANAGGPQAKPEPRNRWDSPQTIAQAHFASGEVRPGEPPAEDFAET